MVQLILLSFLLILVPHLLSILLYSLLSRVNSLWAAIVAILSTPIFFLIILYSAEGVTGEMFYRGGGGGQQLLAANFLPFVGFIFQLTTSLILHFIIFLYRTFNCIVNI